jgi:4-diphosphocytidyl-2-C-methyl-D-erythritol kinase
LSTAGMYARVTPGMYSDGGRVRALVTELGRRRPARIAAALYNGLEPAAQAALPQVSQMRAALDAAGALGTVMSGSGPTVFGVARSLDHARQIRRRVARAPWSCWAVRTLSGPAIRVRAAASAAPR